MCIKSSSSTRQHPFNCAFTRVPWSSHLPEQAGFLKSRLVGEGSTEGVSVDFPLYSDLLDLRSGNGEALMSRLAPRVTGISHS